MEPGGQEAADQEQKKRSLERHLAIKRRAEHALNTTTLEGGTDVGGPAEHIAEKDAHETAARILTGDLRSK